MGDATYYELLGIDATAGPDEVRSAFRRVSTRVHPDTGGTAALFRQVEQAYRTLSDPVRRADYDRSLRVDAGWGHASGPAGGPGPDADPDPEPDPSPGPDPTTGDGPTGHGPTDGGATDDARPPPAVHPRGG